MSTASKVVPARPRAGRPRSEECTRAILEAVLYELVETGYGAMTMDALAARAGTSKATIYRRWSSKPELVADAIEQRAFPEVPIEDTGDVVADVRLWLRGIESQLSGIDGDLFVVLTAERMRHPDFAAAFDRRFSTQRRASLRQLLRRAVERGQLDPSTDVNMLADVGPALFIHQLTLGGGRLPAGFADRIVAQFFPR